MTCGFEVIILGRNITIRTFRFHYVLHICNMRHETRYTIFYTWSYNGMNNYQGIKIETICIETGGTVRRRALARSSFVLPVPTSVCVELSSVQTPSVQHRAELHADRLRLRQNGAGFSVTKSFSLDGAQAPSRADRSSVLFSPCSIALTRTVFPLSQPSSSRAAILHWLSTAISSLSYLSYKWPAFYSSRYGIDPYQMQLDRLYALQAVALL